MRRLCIHVPQKGQTHQLSSTAAIRPRNRCQSSLPSTIFCSSRSISSTCFSSSVNTACDSSRRLSRPIISRRNAVFVRQFAPKCDAKPATPTRELGMLIQTHLIVVGVQRCGPTIPRFLIVISPCEAQPRWVEILLREKRTTGVGTGHPCQDRTGVYGLSETKFIVLQFLILSLSHRHVTVNQQEYLPTKRRQ